MRTLGVILFPGFETLDVFGPLSMFSQLTNEIKVVLLAEQAGLVASSQGQSVLSEFDFESAPKLDLLLVPGGMGTREEINNTLLLSKISTRANQAELVLSVCTGAALLAKAGVLDGHKATTNKRAFDWVTEQGPLVTWVRKARWVDDGRIITSSGISAGIDMSLHAIARLFGDDVRDAVAEVCEYILQTDALDDPFAGSD